VIDYLFSPLAKVASEALRSAGYGNATPYRAFASVCARIWVSVMVGVIASGSILR